MILPLILIAEERKVSIFAVKRHSRGKCFVCLYMQYGTRDDDDRW